MKNLPKADWSRAIARSAGVSSAVLFLLKSVMAACFVAALGTASSSTVQAHLVSGGCKDFTRTTPGASRSRGMSGMHPVSPGHTLSSILESFLPAEISAIRNPRRRLMGTKRHFTEEEVEVKLPMMPIRDVVVFPYTGTLFFVGRESSVRALEATLAADRKIFLATQHSAGVDEPRPNEIYQVGKVVNIVQSQKLPDGNIQVLVEGIERGKILQVTRPKASCKPR